MKKFLSFFICILIILSVAACNSESEEDIEIPSTYDFGNFSGQNLEIMALDKGYGVQWLKDSAKIFNKATGSAINVKSDETLYESIERTFEVGSNVSDMYFTFSSELQWVSWSMTGKIQDITDIVPDTRFRTEEVAKLGIYEGKRYNYPFAYSPTGLVYNQDYLDVIPSKGEYNQGVFPDTWQGLLDMCQSIVDMSDFKNNGYKIYPMSWGGTSGDLSYMHKALWANIDYEGFNAYWRQNNLTSPDRDLLINANTISVLDSISELLNPTLNTSGKYYPGYSVSNAIGQSNLEAQESFLNGYSVFCITGAWFQNEMADLISDANINYHFASFPSISSNQQATYINLPGEYFIITTDGKNKNTILAKEFLKYVLSEENCIYIHSLIDVPLAYTYDYSKVVTTDFGNEVIDILETNICAIGGSDTTVSLSGALTLANFKSSYLSMATNIINSNDILESFYSLQTQNWESYLEKFV